MSAKFETRAAGQSDTPAMARVMVDTYLAAHRGQMPEYLWRKRRDKWTYSESEEGWRRVIADIDDETTPDDVRLVAADVDQVVALAYSSVSSATPHLAPVKALYVEVTHQRRGIGRRLVRAVVGQYGPTSVNELHIGVLASNARARRFYESIGGRLALEREFDEEGVMLPEVVYEWNIDMSFRD